MWPFIFLIIGGISIFIVDRMPVIFTRWQMRKIADAESIQLVENSWVKLISKKHFRWNLYNKEENYKDTWIAVEIESDIRKFQEEVQSVLDINHSEKFAEFVQGKLDKVKPLIDLLGKLLHWESDKADLDQFDESLREWVKSTGSTKWLVEFEQSRHDEKKSRDFFLEILQPLIDPIK